MSCEHEPCEPRASKILFFNIIAPNNILPNFFAKIEGQLLFIRNFGTYDHVLYNRGSWQILISLALNSFLAMDLGLLNLPTFCICTKIENMCTASSRIDPCHFGTILL